VSESGGLARPDNGLTPQARGLAAQLRTLFEGIGLTQTRYAARAHLDKSVVCRYLKGERIPPWDFVHDLLVESTKRRGGTPPTSEVVAHLRALHRAALEAGTSSGHRVMLLQEQLREADAIAQRAESRVQDLEQALDAMRHRVAKLEIRNREFQAVADESHTWDAIEPIQRAGEVHAEHAMLQAEIERLTGELDAAQRRLITAEARCQELEWQLNQTPDNLDPLNELFDKGDEEAEEEKWSWFAAELEAGDPSKAAATLNGFSSRLSGLVLGWMVDPARVGAVLNEMDVEQAAELVNYYLTTTQRAAAIGEMRPIQAAKILSSMSLESAALTVNDMLLSQALPVLNQMGDLKTAALLPRLDHKLASKIESILEGAASRPEPTREFTQAFKDFREAGGHHVRERIVRRLLATVRQATRQGLLSEDDKRRTAQIVTEYGLDNSQGLRNISNLILAGLRGNIQMVSHDDMRRG
jgi:hypothetical protein